MAELEKSPNGWTLDTLALHLGAQIAALDRFCTNAVAKNKEQVDLALMNADKALSKAETATEKRFEAVNEFRAALGDQTRQYILREEYQAHHKALEDKVSLIADIVARMESRVLGAKEGTTSVGTLIFGAFVIINTLVALAALGVSLLHR